MRFNKILAALSACCFMTACCESGGRQAPKYFQLGEKYYLSFDHFEGTSHSLDYSALEACTDDKVTVCFRAHNRWVEIGVINRSSTTVDFDWADLHWIDELGITSSLDVAPPNADNWPRDLAFRPRRVVLSPGERTTALVWPSGKAYYVHESCRNVALFQEPLIPRRLSGSAEVDERIADEVYEEHRLVYLVLPLTSVPGGKIRAAFGLLTPRELTARARESAKDQN